MTIVEREQHEVQVGERERQASVREGRASALEAAALEIEVRGWCRRAPEDPDGAVCMAGAIGYALGFNEPSQFDVVGVATRVFGPETIGIPSWNDCFARDADDVTFVLRWRAQEIRDGR